MKYRLFSVIFYFVCTGLFAQNVSLAFSDYILDELATAISANRKIQVIDRQHMDAIRREFYIEMQGDVSDNEVRRVGQQLGLQYVVTGLSEIIVGYALHFKVAVINIETAVREESSSMYINIDDPQVVYLYTWQRTMQQDGTVGNMPGYSGTYKIGDKGPAGGLIFYDKGYFSSGWRYLEAAPVETEMRAAWDTVREVRNRSGQLVRYEGTQIEYSGMMPTSVGVGRLNTEIIVASLRERGESGRAAQLCDSLNFGGFNDWFLPSDGELGFMYKNLKQKGLGGFQDINYWSSSELGKNHVNTHNFSNGKRSSDFKGDKLPVRAVRAF